MLDYFLAMAVPTPCPLPLSFFSREAICCATVTPLVGDADTFTHTFQNLCKNEWEMRERAAAIINWKMHFVRVMGERGD